MANLKPPCNYCEREAGCSSFKECRAYKMWFSNEWYKIQDAAFQIKQRERQRTWKEGLNEKPRH